MMIAQHHQTAKRRARHHRLLPGAQKANVGDMEPVRILLGRNRPDHQILVQVIRQGQLNQNAMHGGIIVQLVDAKKLVIQG